ncbi:beta-ketoacyl-[acyl-carrier-protein] synthase family protein [Aquihabitans daechungensis]|uniref:beta-ketoacyl-[acyl-carrier-protein] synthase family protein n=1 Tax=Aquihabitans daechungensis TaxID=1052257 RepID=UPI003BA0524B
MSRRRVVVSGIGIVSPHGTDLDRFWDVVSASPPAPVTTQITGFSPRPLLDRREAARSDPFSQYAVHASVAALADAGVDPATVDARRGGVVLSTVYGGYEFVETEHARMAAEGPGSVSSYLSVAACENVAASMVSAHVGWRGPSRVIVTACAGGTHAVAEGADLVAGGRLDVALAGGTQGRITPLMMASYENLRVLSPSGWLRPFDRRRDGFVFAEGSAVLVLEPLAAVRARGGRIYAEVLGSGHTNDAGSMVRPTGSAAVECIEDALADAGVDPGDVVHVNAHGTGTVINDESEAEALHEVFGGRPPPTTSVKRILGHAAGASGAFEAAVVALTLHHGVLPSLGTDVEPDGSLGLDLVVGEPRPFEPGPVLSNSFGLGGANGCLVLGPAT